MLNVRQLLVIRTVMQTGSVSSAARMLHVSQPAVTKSIHLAENTLGIALFVNIKGRLVRTPEADQLLPELDRLFGTMQSVSEVVERVRDGFLGQVRIATVATLSASIVAAAVANFQVHHPGVRIDIRALSTRHVIDYVNQEQVDIGITDVPVMDDELELFPLCHADVGCVMPTNHPLATKRNISPKHLDKENLITFSEDTWSGMLLREAFRNVDVKPKIVITTNNTLSAYSLVQAGAGLALVDPFPALSGGFSQLTIRRFRPHVVLSPHVIIPRRRPISRIAMKFVEEMKNASSHFAAQPGSLVTIGTPM